MTEKGCTGMASKLLETYQDERRRLSMPDQEGYYQMRATFARPGRPTGPEGEIVRS